MLSRIRRLLQNDLHGAGLAVVNEHDPARLIGSFQRLVVPSPLAMAMMISWTCFVS